MSPWSQYSKLSKIPERRRTRWLPRIFFIPMGRLAEMLLNKLGL